MDESEIKELVKEAAKEAVLETLLTLGLDAKEAKEVQADMLHVRKWREATETVKKQSLITAVGLVVVGVLGLIWMAIKGGA